MTDTTSLPHTPPRRHRWPHEGEDGYAHTLPHENADGNERWERTCKLCGMTRITIKPPRPDIAWHEWKTRAGLRWVGESTPPCIGAPQTDDVAAEPQEVQAI